MSRNVALPKIARFGTDVARELALFENAVVTKMRGDDDQEYGPFVVTPRKTASYTARPWEIVECDPSDSGAFTVVLPSPSGALVKGSWIGVKNISDAASALTVAAVGATIEGQASVSVRQPRGYQWFYSTGDEWKRGPSTASDGSVRVLDTKYAPVGLWNMHLGAGIGAKDYSGNGNDMVAETGTARYSALHPTCGGVLFDGSTNLWVSSSPAVLQVTGALSLLVLCLWSDLPTATNFRVLTSHAAAGETSPTNYLWRFSVDQNNQCQYLSEHGAGTDDVVTNNTFSPRGQVALLGLTRSASGVVNFWYNGTTVGAPLGTVTLPTDGSSGHARIGGGSLGAAEFFTGVISSVGVYASELSTTQMLERYNYTLGAAYGYR